MAHGAWSALIFTGYRLQDATCRILDPEKRAPLTRIEILAFEGQVGGSGGFTAMEELVVVLKHADVGKPPSAAILARGDAALQQARDDQAEKERTFLSSVFPQMSREAGSRLPIALSAIGRPDLGLRVLAVVPVSVLGLRSELAAATAALLARRSASISLEDRLNAFSVLSAELRRKKKPMPVATAAAYSLDALEFAGRYADHAETVLAQLPQSA